MWIGYREKANELLMKDPSLLSERARGYAHYPGGHPEAYPDGLKNFLLRVYSHIGGASKEATKVVRRTDKREMYVWLVPGMPVPARVLQRENGMDTVDLTVRSVR
jgi:hypothetical protein